MNNIQLFNQEVQSNRVPLEVLVDHILFRNGQTNAGLVDFNLNTVTEWFNKDFWTQYYGGQEPFLTTEGVTEVGCNSLCNTIVNVDLRRLVQFDILNLFGGIQNSLQMVHQSCNLPTELDPNGVFGDLKLEPEGVEPFYFPNGARAVSSKYLEAVMAELHVQDPNIKASQHKEIMRAVRREFALLGVGAGQRPPLECTYYDMKEGTYYVQENNPKPHLWMSQDLCLNVATKYNYHIRHRVINDLKRLQNIVQMYTNTPLPQPSVQAYLPGTLEEQYREKGLTSLLTGESQGYYPIARVKRIWSEQRGVPEDSFDKVHDPKEYYCGLHRTNEWMQLTCLQSPSSRGGVVQLFHISVLKEYFKDVDFNSLENY